MSDNIIALHKDCNRQNPRVENWNPVTATRIGRLRSWSRVGNCGCRGSGVLLWEMERRPRSPYDGCPLGKPLEVDREGCKCCRLVNGNLNLRKKLNKLSICKNRVKGKSKCYNLVYLMTILTPQWLGENSQQKFTSDNSMRHIIHLQVDKLIDASHHTTVRICTKHLQEQTPYVF